MGAATFLHEQAAQDLKERLIEVNRSFQNALIIGPQAGLWADQMGVSAKTVADDEVLDISDATADLAIHALALHHANDPVGQLVQMRRALRPDGLAVAVMFGGRTLSELRTALAEAETRVRGGLAPRVAPMGDIRELGALLQRAGLAMPVADSMVLNVTYADPLALMRDLRAMGETNVLAAQDRRFLRRDVLAETCRIYADAFSNDDGRIRATFELVYLTGWAPSPEQQKPLRPGSASTRLADALGSEEVSAGEPTGPDQ